MMKSLIKKWAMTLGFSVFRGLVIRMDARQMRNVLLYSNIWQRISSLSGSVVECGVGKGRSFLILTFLADQERKVRKIWGFDSFLGFPDISQEDDSARKPKKGEWSGTAVTNIVSILDTAGLKDYRMAHVSLVEGFFEDSLKKYSGEPIAFLHVDCDLYESYRTVLKTLYPYVVKGGVILFDEYGTKEWPGATKAVDEFLVGQGRGLRLEQEPISKKYMIVKT